MLFFIVITIIIFFIICFILAIKDENDKKSNRELIKESLDNNNFNTTKEIITSNQELRFDTQKRILAICQFSPYKKMDYVNFDDIIECEILEDSNTIMKGGIGRAIVGGVLAGGVGAIVGANTRKSKNVLNSLCVRIITNRVNRSLITINLIDCETKKDTSKYSSAMQQANNIYATITAIINNSNHTTNLKNNSQTIKQDNEGFVEQLEKISKLKKDGMITDKEFEEAKNRILNTKNQTETIVEQATSFDENVDNDIYNIEEKIQLYGIENRIRIIGEVKSENSIGLKEAKKIVDDYIDNM